MPLSGPTTVHSDSATSHVWHILQELNTAVGGRWGGHAGFSFSCLNRSFDAWKKKKVNDERLAPA